MGLMSPVMREALRGRDPYPNDLLALDFAGVATGGRQFYKREGIIVPRYEMLPGALSTGHAGFGTQQVNTAWRGFPANAPLIGDGGLGVWEARTNSIRNPVMAGAVVGVLGAGGAVPTNWIGPSTAGVTAEIVGTGTIAGLPYIDLRLFGTNVTATSAQLFFESNTQAIASVGQTWTAEVWSALISGSAAPLTEFGLQCVENNSLGVGLAATLINLNSGSELTRTAATRVNNQASTVYQNARLRFGWASGASFDFTIRIAAPNLKLGADINDPPILQTSGLAATRTAVAQSVRVALPSAFEARGRFKLSALPAPATFRRVFAITNGLSSDNEMSVFVTSAGNVRLFSRQLNVAQADFGSRTVVPGQTVDFVARFKTDDFALTVNDQPPETDTAGALPTGVTIMTLGYAVTPGGTSTLNGEIANLSIREVA